MSLRCLSNDFNHCSGERVSMILSRFSTIFKIGQQFSSLASGMSLSLAASQRIFWIVWVAAILANTESLLVASTSIFLENSTSHRVWDTYVLCLNWLESLFSERVLQSLAFFPMLLMWQHEVLIRLQLAWCCRGFCTNVQYSLCSEPMANRPCNCKILVFAIGSEYLTGDWWRFPSHVILILSKPPHKDFMVEL